MKNVVNIKTSKFNYFIILIIPILFFVTDGLNVWGDFWFTVTEGKYVLQNGFPHTVPFTIYNNLDFVYQSWGTGVIFYLMHKYFGLYGILFFTMVILLFITYFYYKLCMLVSNNNKMLSSIVTIVTMSFLSIFFITTRPQIFTYLNLVLVLYIMELYTKTNNKKYLLYLPLISLIQINMHGMFFFMLFIFMLPYIVNALKFSFKDDSQERYDLKPIILIMIIMFLTGVINPYGIRNVLYVFTSYGQDILNKTIGELYPLSSSFLTGKIVIFMIFLVYILYLKCKKVPIRYYLLLFGTTYLAFDCYRSVALFVIASLFPLSYLYKNKIPNIDIERFIPKKLKKSVIILFLSMLIFTIIFTEKKFYPDVKEPVDYIVKHYDVEKVKLYNYIDDGSYTIYKGLKGNIDCRAEVFLKKNNHKKDIYKEIIDLKNGIIYYNDYLEKYKFTHLLVSKKDHIYDKLRKNSYNYTLIKSYNHYDIYIRNDLIIKK